jgi:hypothetical protein
MTKEQAIHFLVKHPVKFAHMLGFTKLRPWHNRWIYKMIKDKEDTTLQGSRGTYKTTCVSVALALIIILYPNKRTLFMRKTDTDVKEVIRQVKNILQNERTVYFVRQIYGIDLKLTVDSATELSTNLQADIKGTSQLIGMGIGSSLTGKHFDFIFTDDIVNVKDRFSRAVREQTKIAYQELQNVKNRGGRIFNTGTPWHKDDCFCKMPPAEKWDCYRPEVKEVISDEELAALKESMIPSLFAANYELRHIASEDIIFETPKTGADPCYCEQGIMHVDAAYDGEDWTALTVLRITNGKVYIYGRTWRKHVEDCYDEIMAIYKRFMCGKLWMEDNGDKGFVARDLKKKGLRTVSYHEDMNKFLKISTYLKKAWKYVEFVDGTDEEYISMITDYNENAEHDDCPDSAASALRQEWRRFIRITGEEEDDKN